MKRLLLFTVVFWGVFRGLVLAQTRHEFQHGQMGTLFKLVVYAPGSVEATKAAMAAFARLDTLNQILSDYRDDSELSQLSRTAGTGRWVGVSPDLWAVIGASQKASRLTHGAFDLTIGPLVQLWRRAARQKELPSSRRIRQAKRLVGYRQLQLDETNRRVRLSKPGMRLDAGGIGKGYAVAELAKILQAAQLPAFLIEGGGDLLLGEAPPGLAGWRVAVGDSLLVLANTAVATSGDRFRYAEIDGQRFSHVVDPRTGLGLTHRWQATVIYPDAVQADALASGLGVLGKQKGEKIGQKIKGLRCFFRLGE